MRILFATFGIVLFMNGCAVVSVADAAVSVTATAVKTTANVVGGAVDLAIPDKEEK